MEHHCTYVDGDSHRECRFLGASLTTLGYASEVPEGAPGETLGVYWFAYLCDDHHEMARSSGQVLASSRMTGGNADATG
jgi:hypothetical protein